MGECPSSQSRRIAVKAGSSCWKARRAWASRPCSISSHTTCLAHGCCRVPATACSRRGRSAPSSTSRSRCALLSGIWPSGAARDGSRSLPSAPRQCGCCGIPRPAGISAGWRRPRPPPGRRHRYRWTGFAARGRLPPARHSVARQGRSFRRVSLQSCLRAIASPSSCLVILERPRTPSRAARSISSFLELPRTSTPPADRP
jgi:hypothetical protein